MDDAMLQNAIRTMRECLAHLEELRDHQKPLTMAEAFARRVHPFDCDLVSVVDLAKRFNCAPAMAADFLRSNGAVQLPRTTQGKGVPALVLWVIRNEPHWRTKSARQRVEDYLSHHQATFDPLEI